jgi:FKBP-type peptidyl-prolyl cis-trans isomerase SlyD
MKVASDHVVSIDYQLKLADGTTVDESEKGKPLEYLQGHGQIVPGLEKELEGMAQGEKKKVVVQPKDGYGELDSDAVKEVPRQMFPKDMKLQVGQTLAAEGQQGEVIQFVVKSFNDSTVTIDLNHPLAGQVLHFDIHVAGVRKATDEELTHGHVHGEDGHHH